MKQRYLMVAIGVVLLGAIGWLTWPPKKTVAPTVQNNNTAIANIDVNVDTSVSAPADTIVFSTADLPDRDPAFELTAAIPKTWRAEYVAASSAINLYDPQASGSTNLEKSQIFVKYFSASKFLTLSTVDILSQSSTTISGRPAMKYLIEKKSGIKDFVGQPSWRNEKHTVTDIRSTDQSPTTFYVYAQSPKVSDAVFTNFLTSIKFTETIE